MRGVARAERVREEVGERGEGGVLRELRAEAVDAEVVAPDLAVGRTREEGGLEGRVVVDTERVDDTWCAFLDDAVNTAKPFSTVPDMTDAFDAMWAIERRIEEVPYKRINKRDESRVS